MPITGKSGNLCKWGGDFCAKKGCLLAQEFQGEAKNGGQPSVSDTSSTGLFWPAAIWLKYMTDMLAAAEQCLRSEGLIRLIGQIDKKKRKSGEIF